MSIKIRNLLLIVSLFLCSFQAVGTIYVPNFKNISIEDGLSNNTVRSITKDADGFMWFGTYDGLCRYDGINIKIFRRTNSTIKSLKNNHISTLFSNSQQQLFIGTRKGLCVYDRNKENFNSINYTEFSSNTIKACETEISAIIEDKYKKMFVSTSGEGLLEFDTKQNIFRQVKLIDNIHDLYIHSITSGDNFEIYLAIDNFGIYKYNYRTKKTSLISNKIKQALYLKYLYNSLYIGTNSGLYIYNNNSQEVTEFLDIKELKSPIQFVQVDKNNILWIGTENKGITLFDRKNNSIQNIAAGYNTSLLSSDGLYCMYIDNSNTVWIGTMRGGVEVWNPNKEQFFSRKNMLGSTPAANFVTSFVEIEPNVFWLGSDGGGIQQFNLNNDTYEQNSIIQQINAVSGRAIISLIKDKIDNIWIGTYGHGLIKYNLRTKQIKEYNKENSKLSSNNIWSLFIDSKDNLWIGAVSGGGLFEFNYRTNEIEHRNINADNILFLTETNSKKLLIGNYLGITIYEPETQKSIMFQTEVPVRSIYEDKKGIIWIGTEGNGIMNINLETGDFTEVSQKLDYLRKSNIMAIVEDEQQNLWISTTNGLFRFNYHTDKITMYNKKDGLQSGQFNYSSVLKSKKGLLLFGGINGFSFFDPKSIITKTDKYPLHITDFSVHNKSVFSDRETFSEIIDMLANKDITIDYNDAYFRFDFTAISFDNPEKIQYAYILDGLDKNWNLTGTNRSANYSGLGPGDYTFKVKYATQPNEWNSNILEIKIHVLPPFYRTWWAYFFYIIVIALIIKFAIRIQQRENKMKQDILLADLKEEQTKQVQQMREQFFINISHELRTPLTLIIPPIKDTLSSEPYTPMNQSELRSVYNNANRLLQLINKLLLFRKNEMGKNQLRLTNTDINSFAEKIFENFTQIARKKNIVYLFNAPNKPIEFLFDMDKMEIILYNLISNAFKYTPEYGKIELYIKKETSTTLIISVQDNGCGISEQDLEHIFNRFYSSNKYSGIGIGLSLVKNYVELHHGTLHIETALNKGSKFSLKFDIIAQYPQNEAIIENQTNKLPSKDMIELVEIDTLLYLNQEKSESSEQSDSNLPKILLVEDNLEILAYMKKILAETNMYDVIEATNGKSALKTARKILPEIIISDIHMPEMSGLDLCKAIKEDVETNHIYFIIITADLLEITESKGLRYGADEFITKPFDKTKLLNKINTIFNYQQKIRSYFNNKIILGKNDTETNIVNNDFIDKCVSIVKSNYNSDDFNTAVFAQTLNMSQSALYKKIKLCTGKSISEFIRTIKLSIASELILEGKLNITEIAFEIGINDTKYFRECFKKQYGVNPAEYRNKERKE